MRTRFRGAKFVGVRTLIAVWEGAKKFGVSFLLFVRHALDDKVCPHDFGFCF